MRANSLVAATVLAVAVIAASSAGWAEPENTTLKFAVMRDGRQIGTTTTRLQRQGAGEMTARTTTHVKVNFAYVTLYRYDQSETEQWAGGRLVSLTAVTDDNGTVHRVSAHREGDAIAVDADGKVSRIDPTLIPASPWNPSLVHKTAALNPQDGKVTPVSVVDRGEEQLVVNGRSTFAHHFAIETTFPQDLWYDAHKQLIKVQMRAVDGSQIQYQLE